MKARNKYIAVLLVLALSFATSAPAFAADGTVVHIRTGEDLIKLSSQCSLDDWSRGKTIFLDCDIDLTGSGFSPIPTFGGLFDGNGHTISGISVQAGGSAQGLFRYVQPSGRIQNLKAAGDISPNEASTATGGIVGCNRGRISNCAFLGTAAGKENVGGIAGINEAEGEIINCSFSGSLTGEHSVGGIAGQNLGSIVQCKNSGSVNTSLSSEDAELLDIDWTRINDISNLPTSTDVGGIAGYSAGVIQSCRNEGPIGYSHMGYNIGGIVGRQSGYLDGCTNEGPILGRKDVGGIAGQLEPELTLKYSADTLDKVGVEIDALTNMLDHAMGDASAVSDSLASQMKGVSMNAQAVKDSTGKLAESMADLANTSFDAINDISARIAWALEEAAPLLDNGKEALTLLEASVSQFASAWESTDEAEKLGAGAIHDIRLGLEDLESAIIAGREALTSIEAGAEQLRRSLGDKDAVAAALAELADGMESLHRAASGNAEAVKQIQAALETAQNDSDLQVLSAAVQDFASAMEDISEALEDIAAALRSLAGDGISQENLALLGQGAAALLSSGQELQSRYAVLSGLLADRVNSEDLSALAREVEALYTAYNGILSAKDALRAALDTEDGSLDLTSLRESVEKLYQSALDGKAALEQIESALYALSNSEIQQESIAEIRHAVSEIVENLETIFQAIGQMESALDVLSGGYDSDEAAAAMQSLREGLDSLEVAGEYLTGSVRHIKDAFSKLEQLSSAGSDTKSTLQEALHTLDSALKLLPEMAGGFSTILKSLSEQPSIQFGKTDSTIKQDVDALGASLSRLLQDGENLTHTLQTASGTLKNDLEAVSGQIKVIFDLLEAGLTEQQEAKLTDYFEDVSDTDTLKDQVGGRISSAQNLGTVVGDVNVAGIAGSMALELDFDPEDDLIRIGDRSMNFRYQALAVLLDCENQGTITAKKDYAGGITGRMDLGRISGCRGYGSVTSTEGNYAGGIAGNSASVIRDSWAKCRISGKNYVGGIAGQGRTIQNCHTLVVVEGSTAYTGAVAGFLQADSDSAENTFVSEILAGIDGISYLGVAEPVSFTELLDTAGIPKGFDQFTLTFTAGGETLETIPFQYGCALEALPEIPEKEGYTAQWPQIDYQNLTFSQTLEAEYIPYASSLSAGGEPPQVLVDGTFFPDAELHTETSTAQWEFGGKKHKGTSYTLTVLDPAFAEMSYTVHFRIPDPDKAYTLWIKSGNGWDSAEYEMDGSYLLFQSRESAVTFCLEPKARHGWVLYLCAGAALAAGTAGGIFLHRRRKKAASSVSQ